MTKLLLRACWGRIGGKDESGILEISHKWGRFYMGFTADSSQLCLLSRKEPSVYVCCWDQRSEGKNETCKEQHHSCSMTVDSTLTKLNWLNSTKLTWNSCHRTLQQLCPCLRDFSSWQLAGLLLKFFSQPSHVAVGITWRRILACPAWERGSCPFIARIHTVDTSCDTMLLVVP